MWETETLKPAAKAHHEVAEKWQGTKGCRYIFGMWEKTKAPRGNPHGHRENVQVAAGIGGGMAKQRKDKTSRSLALSLACGSEEKGGEEIEKERKKKEKTIRGEKMRYERKLAWNIKEDSKSFFRYAKRKKIVKNNVGPLKNELGEIVMGNREMAEEFNEYFRSVFNKEDTSNLPDVWMGQGHRVTEEMKQIDIRKEMVMRRLMGLKADKSSGPDGLHPRALKEVTLEIADV
ncbi:uncharacterized protein LOC132404008 [Hypanus sabinus]|uniref:uncharacterized protein LOC132404008 n=1 Tax=Hypanus sabinus TaxID=79690 RepID=UPI0028C50588|nr:uncharacterized protein LOC132404008 [Hypanus sabinus]